MNNDVLQLDLWHQIELITFQIYYLSSSPNEIMNNISKHTNEVLRSSSWMPNDFKFLNTVPLHMVSYKFVFVTDMLESLKDRTWTVYVAVWMIDHLVHISCCNWCVWLSMVKQKKYRKQAQNDVAHVYNVPVNICIN